MVITHNLLALNGKRMNGITEKKIAKTTKKLSSGYKINMASDDAAGLAISEEMRKQIRGLRRGAENIEEGINYCQVADGALGEIHDMLQRMNELSIQSANGTNSQTDRKYIDDEIKQLKKEMQRICDTTKYNETYIFKDRETDIIKMYEFSFSGYPDDLFIYNDSYDDATGEATYGGIAYNGKRYAWSSISPNMYDSKTGKFNEGIYTLKTDDGSYLTLQCENGSKPPQVSREFYTSADNNGIYINGELVSWDDVHTKSGEKFDKDNILDEEYIFQFHGITVSFTPDLMDEFDDVIQGTSGTRWRSTYRIPNERTALFADFSESYSSFIDNQQVRDYLDGKDFWKNYTLRAGDGTNGTYDGVWLEDENGNELIGSLRKWENLGIKDWGDQSRDIWDDLRYEYSFNDGSGTFLSFDFHVINEISKDSAIDALDNVNISELLNLEVLNHTNLEVKSTTYSNVVSGRLLRDSIRHTLEEEYGLGRDYTPALSDVYGGVDMEFNSDVFRFTCSNTRDGVTTTKKYSSDKIQTDAILEAIKSQIKDYFGVLRERYLNGAKDAENLSLPDLIGGSNITGNGKNTYLEDVFLFDPADPFLKSTYTMKGQEYHAGASVDFSGFGTAYNWADLIGLGFNSTCQTCNNHYSLQFTTASATDRPWNSVEINGKNYQYYLDSKNGNYTLYIDVEGMKDIANGVDLTNLLVDIIDKSGFDFHYTQYATKSDDAKLYIFDNRTEYAASGNSSARNADFFPLVYDFDDTVSFDVTLYDEDNSSQSITVEYEYNYGDLLKRDNWYFEYEKDVNGDYVDEGGGKYVKYDAGNPAHQTLDRYRLKDIKLGPKDSVLDEYLDKYIKDKIFSESAQASNITWLSEYARFKLSGQENDNYAMVTEYNTPYQIMPPKKWEEKDGIRIQCSSNINDYIYIPKQKLSLNRLGLEKLSVDSETRAVRAITAIDAAMKKVSQIRSTFGSYQNRLEHSYANNKNIEENTQYAESAIRDTDMAKSMMEYSKNNILKQAGESLMAQANQSSQGVLQLLG